jgi:hypothetical protein
MKLIYMGDTISLIAKSQEEINALCAKGTVKRCNEKPYLLIIEE